MEGTRKKMQKAIVTVPLETWNVVMRENTRLREENEALREENEALREENEALRAKLEAATTKIKMAARMADEIQVQLQLMREAKE